MSLAGIRLCICGLFAKDMIDVLILLRGNLDHLHRSVVNAGSVAKNLVFRVD